MQQDKHTTIAALLRETGAAHGVYEERELNGVYDQNWPHWYASHLLQHGLSTILDRSVTTEELSRLLTQCDENYKRERPSQNWPDYYAERIIAQLGKHERKVRLQQTP